MTAWTLVDDIIDGSALRFRKKCWYNVVGVGRATNDSHTLISCVYILLKKHFSHLDCYASLVDLMTEAIWRVSLGQHFDDKISRESFEKFTQENYDLILKGKSSFCYYFQLGMVMILAGRTEPRAFARSRDLFLEIGYLAQVINDFWDCYDYMDSSFKSGTDIESGKCGWLAVQCLKMASEEQRQVFEKCYGKKDPQCIQKIKDLYDELNLSTLYFDYMKKSCANLVAKAIENPGEIPSEIFKTIVNFYFKREIQFPNIIADYENGVKQYNCGI
ncbi:farnesyl pyrophosphate synthase-like [Phlebotomus argentipes]|uniref:farnesyl pyrophosphate synthase-like n=1 Tax=Phlebotomus argentipes TaxID=94469 RepID=UPI0028930F6A|nr:farnesyl pyrophosphate synthase-like [Phlebotomus argentipes]